MSLLIKIKYQWRRKEKYHPLNYFWFLHRFQRTTTTAKNWGHYYVATPPCLFTFLCETQRAIPTRVHAKIGLLVSIYTNETSSSRPVSSDKWKVPLDKCSINHAFADSFAIVNFAFILLPLLTQQTRLAFTMVKWQKLLILKNPFTMVHFRLLW